MEEITSPEARSRSRASSSAGGGHSSHAPSSPGGVVSATTSIASSIFGGITGFLSSLEWDDPTYKAKVDVPVPHNFPQGVVLVTRRAKYLLEGEEVTLKFQYVEGSPSEMKIELFSIEHGAFGTLFENINMDEIVAQLPSGVLSFKEGGKKVVLEVGPHGLLPIELDKYILSPDVKSQVYEEEIRRLNSNFNILSLKYNQLLARLETQQTTTTPTTSTTTTTI